MELKFAEGEPDGPVDSGIELGPGPGDEGDVPTELVLVLLGKDELGSDGDELGGIEPPVGGDGAGEVLGASEKDDGADDELAVPLGIGTVVLPGALDEEAVGSGLGDSVSALELVYGAELLGTIVLLSTGADDESGIVDKEGAGSPG